jgi:hypothetical protein
MRYVFDYPVRSVLLCFCVSGYIWVTQRILLHSEESNEKKKRNECFFSATESKCYSCSVTFLDDKGGTCVDHRLFPFLGEGECYRPTEKKWDQYCRANKQLFVNNPNKQIYKQTNLQTNKFTNKQDKHVLFMINENE